MNTVYPSSMPFDDVKIIDQSGYIEETVVETPYIPDGPVAFIPFISKRGYGEDNKLQYMTASKLAKYGDPNLKKYGLSLYLARRFADGGGTVLGMRVVPESWAYANVVFSAVVSKKTIIPYQTVHNSIDKSEKMHPVFTDKDGTSVYFDELTIKEPTYLTEIFYNDKIIKTAGKPADEPITLNINGTITNCLLHLPGDDTPITISIANTPSTPTTGDDTGASSTPSYESTPSYKSVPNTTISVKYKTSHLDNLNTSAQVPKLDVVVKNDLNKAEYECPETLGNTEVTIPLFAVVAKGAGTYGNAFRCRYTIDQTMNSFNESVGLDGFFYKFNDSENNGTLDNAITFTFNDDYLYQGESMNIEESFAKYTENVIMIKGDNVEKFKALIQTTCFNDKTDDGEYITNVENVDLLFGSNVDQSKYYVDRTSKDAIDLSAEEGFRLKNGSESTGSESTTEWKFSNDIYATALAKAYNGEITDLIYDHVRYPYQFLFAPSCNTNIISAIHNLATVNRKCTRAHYFVTGKNSDVPATYSDARAALNEMGLDSWKEDVIGEWARISDPFTGKKTFMPSVYFTAFAIPNHWNMRKGKPLAGRLNCTWTGFDVGTVTPASANTNEYVLNHNVGLNTMIEDGIGNAEMYEQITCQKSTSRLSEINNCQILCEMVKIALAQAKAHRWTDLGDNNINDYKSTVETAIKTSLGATYQKMEVVAQRESSNGAGRNRILCKINVLFKDMFKGVSYEFYILAQ